VVCYRALTRRDHSGTQTRLTGIIRHGARFGNNFLLWTAVTIGHRPANFHNLKMRAVLRPTSSALRCSQLLYTPALQRTSLFISKINPHSKLTHPNFSSTRLFSTSFSRNQAEVEKATSESKNATKEDPYVYNGPLTAAFRRLKLFSLGSFGLSLTLSPFIFLIESNLPLNARFALAGIALGTSGLSTGLVAWCARPYVTVMRRFPPEELGGAEEVELTTYTITMQPRITRVHSYSLLLRDICLISKFRSMIHLS